MNGLILNILKKGLGLVLVVGILIFLFFLFFEKVYLKLMVNLIMFGVSNVFLNLNFGIFFWFVVFGNLIELGYFG